MALTPIRINESSRICCKFSFCIPDSVDAGGLHYNHNRSAASVGVTLGDQSNGSAGAAAAAVADSSELLLDLLFKSQALRMNDQRCDLNTAASNHNNNSTNHHSRLGSGDLVATAPNGEDDSFLDLLISLQVSLSWVDQRAFINPPQASSLRDRSLEVSTYSRASFDASDFPPAPAETRTRDPILTGRNRCHCAIWVFVNGAPTRPRTLDLSFKGTFFR